MANVYVRSGAGGAGTGADWANAYTTLSAALTAKAAGDDFWVSEDHAEVTAGAVTNACPGTVGTPCRIICVNHAGSVPPVAADLATTATISTTGANAITNTGHFYCYGIIFQAASTAGAVNGSIFLANTIGNYQRYDSSVFRLLGTTTSLLSLGVFQSGGLFLNNCSVKFAAATTVIVVKNTRTIWQNSSNIVDATGTLPTALLGSGSFGSIYFEGVDFSALSAKTIFANLTGNGTAFFKDCKLPASVTLAATQTLGLSGGEATFIRCDSGATNYLMAKHNYAGVLTTETTIIRTGGASDGTQGVAYKVITPATGPTWFSPFTCIPITIWCDSTSSVTATVCGIWGGGAVPNNDDIWMDVEYLGSGSTPLGSFATGGKASALATNAALASDSSTWGGSTTKFKMTATFTPGMKGPITAYIRCAKANTTFYIDPLIVLT